MTKEERKIYIRQHYQNNKQYYIDKAAEATERKIQWYKELKTTLKCEKCGENHSYCLEFHHADDNKEFAVSNMIKRFSKKRILEEISKCMVLCANCHRKLHYAVNN